MKGRYLLVLVAVLNGWSFSAFAFGRARVTQEDGYRLVPTQVTEHGYTIPYTVYLPGNSGSVAGLPITLFLHGAGQRGTDGKAQLTVGIGPAFAKRPTDFNTIIVLPQMPDGVTWTDHVDPNDATSPLCEDLALKALDETTASYAPSSTRVYLTGLSLGGMGTYAIAARFPHRFAAIMPIAGTGDLSIAPALAHEPIWAFHGGLDTVVPVQGDRDLVAAIRATGNPDLHYTEFPQDEHDSWDDAYADEAALQWLFSHSR